MKDAVGAYAGSGFHSLDGLASREPEALWDLEPKAPGPFNPYGAAYCFSSLS